MIAVHARYRGNDSRRADLVKRSAEALATLDGVGHFDVVGVEGIRTHVADAEAACMLVMALLSDGNWAVGIGITQTGPAIYAASDAVGVKAGTVGVVVEKQQPGTDAADIASTFALLGYVLAKRTVEGREATALVRSGFNQNEAAAQLGISKQAMSQRLQAAGWHAEQSGWQLAVNLMSRAAGAPQ
ncbi:MarR family transcriptional regulator [Corynebacterium tuscaniense]|uniref:MarR family transcriptional regulator n=1 Tax=Corynebacterium tuscaniense TaxID=302449 RepID=A0A2N6T741_9CORY|nr:MarR family transcriptional regulator [Corynebacterium tuscaniense]PMC65141.1 MarR family transcriptional regulator [Corynebacterium tuscaniense]